MQINQEARDKHSIQAYDEIQIKVNNTDYSESLIVSKDNILSPWPLHCVTELNETLLKTILDQKPEIIIIGHRDLGKMIPFAMLQYLTNQRIGVECMSVGAACRTFNVLLSEQRAVVLGIVI